MSRTVKRIAFVLIFALLLQGVPIPAKASNAQYRMNIEVWVDDAEIGNIPAFDDNYENHMYVSLKGLAYALQGTAKAFTPAVEKRKITITTGIGDPLTLPEWTEETLITGSVEASKHQLFVDDSERKYYSFILASGDGYDAFMTPVSLAMMLDLDMKVTGDGIEIDTSGSFSVSAEEMEESGYLQGVNALVIGDATTGEIFYQYRQDVAVPIASTTKLMTYYILMNAVAGEECSLDDKVEISERAAKLAVGSDGIIPLTAGSRIPLTELMYGMLLPSSNECALAIAEHVAGSLEAFVERMNATAEEFGWTNARFYNSHGLPNYEDQLIPAKVQNHMTAEEMFRLASVIMETYPQVTELTSTKLYHMNSFNMDVKNTNVLLYNMENAVGLKTGTTNKAGACLVTCVTAKKDGEKHDLIVVLFGADGDANRGIVSEMSARYAMEALREARPVRAEEESPEEQEGQEDGSEEETGIPEDPERVIRELIRRKGL